ncbi:MAG: GFA family protein [Aliishimia sp.]
MSRSGGCNCGNVRFEISSDLKETGACHCEMCRKFTGGVFLSVQVAASDFKLTKVDGLKAYKSSEWAERAFCQDCGSSLFYRMTAPGPMQGSCHVGLGCLDDAEGIVLTDEIFVDSKPSGYEFAGDTRKMTGAEVFAMYGPPAD